MIQCTEKAGFLFDHRCKEESSSQCQRCSKPICSKHGTDQDGQIWCISCVKKQGIRQRGRQGFSRDRHYHDDRGLLSPFFYSSYYYTGYGYYGHGYWGHDHYHHHDDFTEADGASMQAGDEDFEQDMGAS